MNQEIQKEYNPHPVRDFIKSKKIGSQGTYKMAIRRFIAESLDLKTEQIPEEWIMTDTPLVIPGVLEPEEGKEKETYISFMLSRLTASKFETLISSMEEKYNPRTVTLTVTAIRGVMAKMKREKLISPSEYIDIMEVEIPEIPKDHASRRFLTDREVLDMLKACERDSSPWGIRDLAILQWMFTQGPRCSEVVNAKIQDYDPRTGDILIKAGKGNKDRENVISNGAKKAMDQWIETRGPKPGALFPRIERGGPGFEDAVITTDHMTPLAVTKILEKRREEAGVREVLAGKKFTPHTCRRTAGNKILEVTGDIQAVADILGHENLDTTKKAYIGQRKRESLEKSKAVSY